MPLTIGTLLGNYAIVSPIGAGGMGEVYRARDTKLDRDVAIKILPAAFAADAGRMARFEREAKVLASLNHPNIAQIYGVEDRALVMELVEGESPKGPMPFDEAWKIALQMAEALEYAHERGIVHRDLKPANVKVTPEGVVKLLDFGLAKAFSVEETPSANPDNSPTLTMGATNLGVILGTAAYMAPEQAKGKRVDKRADIWSWGVVLYELLTGEQLFKGTDVSEILARVIKEEPALDKAPAKTRRLLRKCLEKDPKPRLRDIGDAPELLEDPIAQPMPRTGVAWIAALVLLVALGAVSFLHFREAGPRTLHATIPLPENTTAVHSFAISPDGRLLAIAAVVEGKRQLWLHSIEANQARPMPGTDDAAYPFWSPDSRNIAFFAQGKLKKIAARGGPAQWVCDAPDGRGGSWNRQDLIIFSPAPRSAIQSVPASGGVPAEVTRRPGFSAFPLFLPGGRSFLYKVSGISSGENGVYLGSLDGKENRRVLPDDSSAIFISGWLLFSRGGALIAQRFDPGSGHILGEASPIAEGVSATTNTIYLPVTVSDTGLLLYDSGGWTGANLQMAWYDRGGRLIALVGARGPVLDPAVSPDEKSIAFGRRTNLGQDLWIRDLSRDADRRFTTDPSANIAPFWSPHGDHIVFGSNRASGTFNLYQKSTSGTGQDELLLSTANPKFPTQWSRDGRFIVFSQLDPKTRYDISVLPIDGGAERRPVPFLQSEFDELHGQLSPDSRWMAYTSDESGRREVYVRPFPAGDFQKQISIAGGEQPRWRGDGNELFFLGANGKMMAVAMNATAGPEPSLTPAAPQPLFEAHVVYSALDLLFQYDVTADGKRFLLDTTEGATSAPLLNVVTNWDVGLKK